MQRLKDAKNNVRRGWTRDLDDVIKYFNGSQIYTLEVKITSSCVMNCLYCYASSTKDSVQQMSTQTLCTLLDDAADCGVQQISWGGGEPLERADWREVMAYARDTGLRNLVMTNGMELSDPGNLADFMDLVEMVSVHIDTFDQGIWARLHGGMSPRFDAQIQGLEGLIESGFDRTDMALYMTLTDPLFIADDYLQTIDLAYDHYGISVIMYPFRAFGFGKDVTDLNPTKEQMARAYQYRNAKDGIPSGPGFGSKFYCSTSCHVGSGGELFGCSMVLPSYVGNIHRIGFKDLYDRNSHTLTYHQLKDPSNIKGKCSSCADNSFCWGCRGASDIVCGDFTESDPFCWK